MSVGLFGDSHLSPSDFFLTGLDLEEYLSLDVVDVSSLPAEEERTLLPEIPLLDDVPSSRPSSPAEPRSAPAPSKGRTPAEKPSGKRKGISFERPPPPKRISTQTQREESGPSERCKGPRSSREPGRQLSWPSAFLSMSDVEARATMYNMATTKDRRLVSDMTHSQREASLANHFFKVGALLESVMGQGGDVERLQETLEDQKKELKNLRSRVKELEARNTNLESKNSSLETQQSKLKDKLQMSKSQEASLAMEVARLKEEHEAEITRLSAEFIEREPVVRAEGMKAFRDRFLLSSSGQTFLKQMHEGLLAAYLKSKAYFVTMLPPCSSFYKHGFQSAVSQAENQGFKGTFDQNGPYRTASRFLGWKGNPAESKDFPWWHQPIQEACRSWLRASLHEEDLLPARSPKYLPAPPTELPAESSSIRDSEA